MKKVLIIKSFISVLALTLFTGCLSQLKTREDLRGQTEISQPEAIETAAPAEENEVITSSTPAYKQEERNEQIRVLHGRVEEAENQVQELRESMIELATSRQQEKEASQAKLQAYEEAIRALEAEIQNLKKQNGASAPSAPAKNESKKSGGENARDLEDYHRGEDFFRQKKWKDAIVSYQKYRDNYPKGKFYPEATYQIGLCFLELGLKDESKSFFEEVKVKFPKSAVAKKADKKLKSL